MKDQRTAKRMDKLSEGRIRELKGISFSWVGKMRRGGNYDNIRLSSRAEGVVTIKLNLEQRS